MFFFFSSRTFTSPHLIINKPLTTWRIRTSSMKLYPSRPLLLTGLLLVLAGAAGCAGGCRDINPDGPERLAPPPYNRVALSSMMAVPIEIPVDEISALVNNVVRQDLYSVRERPLRKGILRFKLDMDVRRNGGITTGTRYGKVINSIPLLAEGRVRVPPGVWKSFSTTFVIHATTDLSLDSTWATEARTYSAFTWETVPTIRVAGLNISVKGTAEKALVQQLARVAPRIDRIIEERINLRRRVDRVWESLHEPIAVSQKPPVWLTIRPAETYFSPGVSRNDTLVFGLQMHAFVETTVGDRPASPARDSLPPLLPLPDSLAADSLQGFQVNLPVSITYDDARALLAQAVADKDYEVREQVAIKVSEIDLYGHGESLVARVDFSADVADALLETQGRVFLTGLPGYDSTNQTIRVDSFNYDIHSRNALAEAADWIYRDDFLAQTQERLVFPLTDKLIAAQERLAEALRNRPLGKHIILDGTIDELEPGALYLVEDGINVDVFARGQLTAQVHSLDDIRPRRPAADSTVATADN